MFSLGGVSGTFGFQKKVLAHFFTFKNFYLHSILVPRSIKNFCLFFIYGVISANESELFQSAGATKGS